MVTKNHAIYQSNKQTSLKNNGKEPVEPVQMNIYQIPIEDLNWQHFADEPKVQERQQVKDQVLHIHFCSLSNNSKKQLRVPAQT